MAALLVVDERPRTKDERPKATEQLRTFAVFAVPWWLAIPVRTANPLEHSLQISEPDTSWQGQQRRPRAYQENHRWGTSRVHTSRCCRCRRQTPIYSRRRSSAIGRDGGA